MFRSIATIVTSGVTLAAMGAVAAAADVHPAPTAPTPATDTASAADHTPTTAPDPQASIAEFKRQHRGVRVVTENGLVTGIHGRAFSHGDTAAASIEAFLNDYVQWFGVPRSALVELRIDVLMNGKLTAHHYEQKWRGIPVDGTRVSFIVRADADHPLVLIHAKTAVIPDDLPEAKLTAEQAQTIARQAAPNMVRFEPATLVVHPRTSPPVLAWFFWAESAGDPGFQRWGFYIDAVTGKVLEKRNGILHTDITGTVTGQATPGILPDQPNNPPQELGIHGSHVYINGGGETFVNGSGFLLPHAGDQQVTVRLNLYGQWARVEDVLPAIPDLTAQMNVVPPGPANFLLNQNPTEYVTAQLNGMIHATTIHDFVKEIIPEFNGIDLAIPTRVNRNEDCNAFYTIGNPSINFFTSQAGPQPHCPNTANSTVVYHEYGHFIIDRSLGGAAAGDYHEGVADAIAALLVDDPCVGPDFFGQDTGCLRHADEPDFTAPVGHPDPHCSGLAIAGAYWDLRDELVDRLGYDQGLATARQLMYNQILAGPGEICDGQDCSDITLTVLTLDDDDADIFNGTPNYVAIERAFSAHGMPGPQLSLLDFYYPEGITRTASPLTGATVPLQVVNGDIASVDAGAVTLHYSINGGAFSELSLAATNLPPDGADFEVTLPAADCFATLRWYVSADTTDGDRITDPPTAPDDTYTTLVVTTLESVLEDNFEADLGWSSESVAYDDPFEPGQQNLTTGGWERADPEAVVADVSNEGACVPNVDVDFSQPDTGYPGAEGVYTYVTGPLAGDLPGSFDVDWGPVRLVSPVLEVPGGLARFSYARWFFNDDDDDGMTVEISNDGGASWTPVETVTGRTDWVKVEFSVSDFVEPTDEMVFRFSTGDEPNNSITEAAIDEFTFVTLFCALADSDHDFDVDLHDFGGFQRCYTGPDGGPLDAACVVFDFDLDDDVDLTDYRHFVAATTGAGGPP